MKLTLIKSQLKTWLYTITTMAIVLSIGWLLALSPDALAWNLKPLPRDFMLGRLALYLSALWLLPHIIQKHLKNKAPSAGRILLSLSAIIVLYELVIVQNPLAFLFRLGE